MQIDTFIFFTFTSWGGFYSNIPLTISIHVLKLLASAAKRLSVTVPHSGYTAYTGGSRTMGGREEAIQPCLPPSPRIQSYAVANTAAFLCEPLHKET